MTAKRLRAIALSVLRGKSAVRSQAEVIQCCSLRNLAMTAKRLSAPLLSVLRDKSAVIASRKAKQSSALFLCGTSQMTVKRRMNYQENSFSA